MQDRSSKIENQSSNPEPSSLSTTPDSTESYQKSFLFNSALGGAAALFMEGILHPIDTIRTRVKANTRVYVPFFEQVKKMYHREGPSSYFRGFSCTLCGSFIANGSYFYIYERLKHELNKREIVPHDVSPFIAGFVGGFMSDFIYLPFDVIRTRMQLKPGVYDYRHVFDGARKIVKYEGFRTLYLGAPVFFTLSALITSFMFGFYEFFHRVLKPVFPDRKDGSANMPLSVCSSVMSGALAALLTNPLDVLVTRIQSVNTAVEARYTILGLIKTIYKNEGMIGFMKGVTGTMGYYAISSAILFPTYELLKVLFGVDLSEG